MSVIVRMPGKHYTLGKDGMDVRDAGYAMDITYSMDGNGCYGCQGYCGCLGCL